MRFAVAVIGILFACSVQADEFSIAHNGQTYICRSNDSNPEDSLECVNKAYAGPFNKEESIALCSGGVGLGPVECALKAYSGPFNKEESIRLCKRNGSVELVDCALKAYAGPYNKEEAIEICKGSRNFPLLMRSFKLFEAPELQQRILEIKSQLNLNTKRQSQDI